MAASARAQAGFILVATLWILAALTVLAAYIDGVVASDIERAATAKRALQGELQRRDTEATLIYLLATGRMNHRGLILEQQQRFADDLPLDEFLPDQGDGEVTVTGEVYAGLGSARFAVQDEAGLASVNSPYFPLFAATLRRVGVSRMDIAKLLPKVEDYIDQDRILRLGGAEFFDYQLRQLPPPPNWIMASPLELKKVLGVGDILTPAQWERLRPLLTMRQAMGYNFNTMHPEVLAAMLGTDERSLQDVLEERSKQRLSSLNRIAMLTGTRPDIDSLDMLTYPSRSLRIYTWYQGSGSRIVAGIRLTPSADRAPWRKDYQYAEFISDADSGTTRQAAAALLQ